MKTVTVLYSVSATASELLRAGPEYIRLERERERERERDRETERQRDRERQRETEREYGIRTFYSIRP